MDCMADGEKGKKESCRNRHKGLVFTTEKDRKTLKNKGFYLYARDLHLSIDLLVFLAEICKFMRSEQKINRTCAGLEVAS